MGITAAGATALAIGASGALAAGASLYGSSQAAGAAKDAANVQQQAANQADARYQQTRTDLSPYFQPGYNALTDAYALARQGPNAGGRDYVDMAYQNLPMQMTQAQLEQTPGYQFDLSQGQKAVQSAAAARGLGVSGASLKGAGNFATGLANKTYLDQFNVSQKRFEDIAGLNTQQQGQITNQFNRLNAIGTLGENAAAQTGSTGAALANTATSALNLAGNYINQGGLASAAGTTGAANALTGSVNNYLAYQNMQNLLGNNATTKGYDPNAY